MPYSGRERAVELFDTEEGRGTFLNREREEEIQRQRERERGRRTAERKERESTDSLTRGRRQRRLSLHHVTCSSIASQEASEVSGEEEPQEEEPTTPAEQLAKVFRHNENMLGSLRERTLKERIQNAKRFTDAEGRVLGHIQAAPPEFREVLSPRM